MCRTATSTTSTPARLTSTTTISQRHLASDGDGPGSANSGRAITPGLTAAGRPGAQVEALAVVESRHLGTSQPARREAGAPQRPVDFRAEVEFLGMREGCGHAGARRS